MTQNIEQRTEVAVTKYEHAANKVEDFAESDSLIDTNSGTRKSFPKLSREIEEAGRESLRLGAAHHQGNYAAGVTYDKPNWTYTYNSQQWGLSRDFDLSTLPYEATEADPNNDSNLAVRGDASEEFVRSESISEWTSAFTYSEGHLAKSNGVIYESLGFQSGNKPDTDDGTNWTKWKLSASSVKPTRANSQQEYDDNKPSQMPTLQSKDLIGVNVVASNADTAGRMVIFRKSGNGFVAENLVSGIPSGGESVSLSCPVWRFGRVDHCQNIAPYKHTYSDTNFGGLSDVTTGGSIWSGGTTILQNGFKLWRATGAGGYIDFETSEKEISVLVGSAADSVASMQVQIYTDEISPTLIETHIVKTDVTTGYDVFLWKVNNPLGGRPVRVRFTASDLSTRYLMVGGVNASLDEFKSKDIDSIAFYIIQDEDSVINGGEGAQNYTIQEITTGLFGGESHGGEFISRRNVYFDETLQSLSDDTFFVCGRVSVEQLSQVIWDDANNINMDVAGSLTLTSEGSQFTGYFVPRNVVATTAYFAMFTHQGTFNRVRFPKYIDVSGETDPIQLQTGQGSGFKATDAKGRIVEAEWSEIYKGNPNYKPYLQVKPQNNPYNKYYYGVALPPEGGVEITPFGYVMVRKYSS